MVYKRTLARYSARPKKRARAIKKKFHARRTKTMRRRPLTRAVTTTRAKKWGTSTISNYFGLRTPTKMAMITYVKAGTVSPALDGAVYYTTGSNWTIRLNSVFDPNYGTIGWNTVGVGHSTLSAHYNHYMVKSCKLDIWIRQISGYSSTISKPDLMAILRVDDDAAWLTTTASWNKWALMHNCKTRCLQLSWDAKARCHFTLFWTNKHYLGRDNSRMWAAVGANPEEQQYAMLAFFTRTGDVLENCPSFQLSYRARYYTKYAELKDPSGAVMS